MSKTQYVIFGNKGFLAEVSAADQNVAGGSATSLTVDGTLATDAGFLPIDHAHDVVGTSTDAYNIIIKAAGSTTGDRANDNLNDFATGLPFTAAANPAAGDVTALRFNDWDVANTNQVVVITAAGANGYHIQNTDKLWLEQTAAHATALPFGTISTQTCLPMKNFIGADQVAYAQEYWDGTALDRTVLSFKSTVGDATDDTIILTHTAGKYKEICAMMENLANADNYDNPITVFDLDSSGLITQFDSTLGIVGCFVRSAAK